MSLPQDKTDSQYRKSAAGGAGAGRSGNNFSGQHRNYSGGRGRGGPGLASNNSNNRSFKKVNNAQGAQPRANPGSVNTQNTRPASGASTLDNGGHAQPLSQGVSSTPAPVTSPVPAPAPAPAAIAKPADVPSQKSGRPLPRAPSSQSSSSTNLDSTLPSTPAKGDGAKGFAVQFGSLSPGFMNGMQVPARTSSAPPNLDEQKHQARLDASRASVPAVPLPIGSKQATLKKDAPSVEKPIPQETKTEPHPKKDMQVASASPPTQGQKASSLPMTGIPMPSPYHQPTASKHFTGPNPQMQPQVGPTSTHQMPIQMPMPMGNPPQVPQPVYVTSLQHSHIPSHGIMHQGGYNPQLATQLPHQLNLGINPFNQPPVAKFGNRKTVKITHPDTHEELRLDGGSSRSMSHHSAAQQNQSVPAFAANQMGYYSNSYTAGPPFYPAPSTLSNATTQGSRFNFPGSQASTISVVNQPSGTLSVKSGVSKYSSADHSNADRSRDALNMIPPAHLNSTPVTIKAAGEKATNSNADRSRDPLNMIPSARLSSTPVTIKAAGEKVTSSSVGKSMNPIIDSGAYKKDVEVNVQSKSVVGLSNKSAPTTASVPPTSPAVFDTTQKDIASNPHVDAISKGSDVKSISIGDMQTQPSKKGILLPSQQTDGESNSEVINDINDSSKTATSDIDEATIIRTSSKDDVSEAIGLSPIVTDEMPSDSLAVKFSANSTHSPDNCESQNVIQEACKLSAPPSSEINTKESSIGQDKAVEEYLQGLPYKSVKVLDAVKGGEQDHQIKHEERAGPVGGATEVSQREGNSVTSDVEVENMQAKHSDVFDAPVSNTTSGLLNDPSFKGNDVSKSSMSDNEAIPVSENSLEVNSGHETELVENPRPSSSSGSISGSTQASMELNKTRNRGKKLKELLQKADALGTTADLYMAYKGPEEKKENPVAPQHGAEGNVKEISADAITEESTQESKDEQSKADLDDWEDADISSPKMESFSKGVHDEVGVTEKKYSRDFLLTCSDHCTDLPVGFEITPDVAEALMRVSVGTPRSDREYPSGRAVDRTGGVTRLDRRGVGMADNEKWNKPPNHFPPVQDPRMDLAYGSNVMGFDGGRGPHGVLRHPRVQGTGHLTGGILSGPMRSTVFQGIQRNNSDADRWQPGANFKQNLMPSPHIPIPVMHKAEIKYEVGKVTDEEQAKQRKLKGILNKLTPQNFERLFEQVKEVNIDNVTTLTGVISQIFDKALTEPTFCEMYANFCQHLASELPDLSVDDEKITFRRLLLNKCQEEFERGEREEQEAYTVGEGDTEQSEEVREQKKVKARRRMLGNIRLIGELYKKRMLTERIMHECIKKLLGQYQEPDEENIEALCKLMSTIGEMIDHPKAKDHMDAYFDIMGQLSNNMKLSSRVRFMLRDAIDLRKNKWQQRRKVEGPKKIEEVHRDAAQERQGQVSRLNRGPSMNSAIRRSQPLEFGPRGSMLPSPVGPGMGYRGMPPQGRAFGGQDMRTDDRSNFDSRTASVPLPQRSDEPITLVPQGGLRMGFRGQPSMSNPPIFDNSQMSGDPRRMTGHVNGYGAVPDHGAYSTREDHFMRNTSDRFGSRDQSSNQEHHSKYLNREVRYPEKLDKSRPTTPNMPNTGASVPQNNYPEEQLRDKSLAAIKEYYSAKDENEVALCIRDLNAPRFYPTMVSIWVNDSFERKNIERDLLAEVLVSLTKSRVGTFSTNQLIQGFESVLADLEDMVTDAPKAPEYLGRIFAKIVLENVLPLSDLGRLIQHGGEKPGKLIEAGLAAEVLGSLFEMIKSEKGEPTLNEIRASCTLHLEDFRPPHPVKCQKLEMFM